MATPFELLRKKQNKFVTNLEDKRAARGLAKQQAVQEANLNRPAAPIEQANPRPVSLADAKPSATNARVVGPNPNFNVDTHGAVTRDVNSGRLQSQDQRIQTKQAKTAPDTTVQQNRAGLRNQVDITARDGTVHKVHVGQDGSTLSDSDLKAQNAQRAQASARAQAEAVLQNTKAYSAEQVRAAGDFLKSGAATEAVGEIVGNNARTGSEGFNRGLSGDAAAIEAEAPLQRPAAASEGIPGEANTLRGPAAEATLRTPPPAAPGAPEAPAAATSESAPKSQRTVLGKVVDGVKGFDPLNKPVATDSGGGKTAGLKGKVGSAIKGVGALGTADLVGQFGKAIALNDENAPEVIANAVGDFTNHVTKSISDGNGMELVKELGDALIRSPATIISSFSDVGARLGGEELKFIANGLERLGVPREYIPEIFLPSQITGENADFAASLRDINDPDYLPQTEGGKIIKSLDGQLPDALRFSGGQEEVAPPEFTGQSAPAPQGLREQPAGNGSFFINNGPGGSGIEGLAGGTGGEAQGEKQFFDDLPQAFPEAANAPRGLSAAQQEISGRGRFSDDPLANFAGEATRSRLQSNRVRNDLFEDRTNRLGLSAASTAGTAARAAEAKRYSEIDAGLNSEDERVRRNTRTGVFGNFTNQINQGNYDPNSADARQTANIVTRSVIDGANPGFGAAVWNSLAPAILGGGGRGALDFLNGDANINGGTPFADIAFDGEGNLMAKSTDPDAELVNLGFVSDPDTANFLRQMLSVHKNKGQ